MYIYRQTRCSHTNLSMLYDVFVNMCNVCTLFYTPGTQVSKHTYTSNATMVAFIITASNALEHKVYDVVELWAYVPMTLKPLEYVSCIPDNCGRLAHAYAHNVRPITMILCYAWHTMQLLRTQVNKANCILNMCTTNNNMHWKWSTYIIQ